MKSTFETFNNWGDDAKIISNPYRRQQSWRRPSGWPSDWDDFFTLPKDATIPAEALHNYRDVYDALIAAIVRDLTITRARARYTSDQVSLNAHAPIARAISGSDA